VAEIKAIQPGIFRVSVRKITLDTDIAPEMKPCSLGEWKYEVSAPVRGQTTGLRNPQLADSKLHTGERSSQMRLEIFFALLPDWKDALFDAYKPPLDMRFEDVVKLKHSPESDGSHAVRKNRE